MTPVSTAPASIGAASTAVNGTPVQSSTLSAEEIVRDGCVSVKEAASFLGISKSTVYQLMESGELRYVRLGGRRLVPRRLLTQLLAQHLTEAR